MRYNWKETVRNLNWLKENKKISQDKWIVLYSHVYRYGPQCEYEFFEDPILGTWDLKAYYARKEVK